jgi:Uma2 family endonuclease
MARTERKDRYTYQDLQAFPEDKLRREIIDGELVVTAAPGGRHQDAVLELGSRLLAWVREHGGKVYVAPRDVFFSDHDVVEPDVVFVREIHLDRVEEWFVRGAPDVVVEVSSPTTRRLELHRKRELYERFGVPEYWYVDLESDRIEVYRLAEGRYGTPVLLGRGEALESDAIPGFSIGVEDVLGPPED